MITRTEARPQYGHLIDVSTDAGTVRLRALSPSEYWGLQEDNALPDASGADTAADVFRILREHNEHVGRLIALTWHDDGYDIESEPGGAVVDELFLSGYSMTDITMMVNAVILETSKLIQVDAEAVQRADFFCRAPAATP